MKWIKKIAMGAGRILFWAGVVVASVVGINLLERWVYWTARVANTDPIATAIIWSALGLSIVMWKRFDRRPITALIVRADVMEGIDITANKDGDNVYILHPEKTAKGTVYKDPSPQRTEEGE